MAIYKRILKFTSFIFCIFLLASCSKNTNEEKPSKNINEEKSFDFPTDEKGYPNKVVLIDNKSYELKKLGYEGEGEKLEIKVTKSTNDFTKIQLPKVVPTHSWNLEGENDRILKEHKVISLIPREKESLEGVSDEVQEYIIKNKEIKNNKLIFKWKNIDLEKDPYILTIIFN